MRRLLTASCALLAISAMPSQLAAQGIPSGPYLVEPARPFGAIVTPRAQAYDPIELQTFVATLTPNDLKEVHGRCGVILSNPGAFSPDATAFCDSFKLAATLAPKTDANEGANPPRQ
ncbi:MAG: hypothetical protein U1E56_09050 [Bauldia sp.]